MKAVGGAIVTISSFAGLMGSPMPGGYAASKLGIRGLTKVAAMELGSRGIRVNSAHPGYLRTPLLEAIPDDAAYCTGAEFAVDGGWSAGEPTPIFVPPGAAMPEVVAL